MMDLGSVKRAARYIFRGIPVKQVYVNISQIQYGGILKGRNIVITGGGHGIGKCIAEKFISEGAKVLIIGRNKEMLCETCNELGNKCDYIVFDLENIEKIELLWEQITAKMRTVDTLVCNAGISLHEGDILHVSQEQFEKQMKVNLESVYFLIKQSILNKTVDELNILCISSERGFQCDDLPYGLTKVAMNSLVGGITKKFYSKGVRINGIAPGITTSDLTKKTQNDDLVLERVTPGRYILGEEIAETACFLISDSAKCISGEVIACDAGEYLCSYVH